LIIGVLVPLVLVLVLLVGFVVWKKSKVPLLVKELDDDVSWQWKDFLENPSIWKERSNYYFKVLTDLTAEYSKVQDFFYEKLNGKDIKIRSIEAVYNNELVSSFMNKRKLMMTAQEEAAQPKWAKDTHSSGKDFSLRSWVYNSFQKKKDSFEWNTRSPFVILPTVHGTSRQTAEKICETGFNAYGTQDNGSFGKGVYFTTNANYTIPFITDCVIISYVLTGEIYPVIGTEVSMLHGVPLKRGYNCHYVITKEDGTAPPFKIDEGFDEIVIDQEAQIAPAFVIEVEISEKPREDMDFDIVQLDK